MYTRELVIIKQKAGRKGRTKARYNAARLYNRAKLIITQLLVPKGVWMD